MAVIFAVDLGGTHVKSAIIDKQCQLYEKDKTKTPDSLEDLTSYIREKVRRYAAYEIEGIAISSPGAVTEAGVILGASAIPYIHGPNIKEHFEKEISLPVQIENDANCSALAELWKGEAEGKKNVAVVVIGTGVGGALIKDGSIHKGIHLHAGEFGYMILNPANLGSGQNTFSELASTSSIIRRAAAYKNVDRSTLTGEKVFQLAEAGDEACIRAIDEFYHMLAIGLYNIQYAYDPELILIGGGISNREDILKGIDEKLAKVVKQIKIATVTPEVDRCQFSSDANLIGAVYHYLYQ
ncbi:ROK family protein [Paraliobacillus sp. JSM ZJ581]|uniref:ROK family protein n=1 Tax=Paraliobacillus sp. JSM ZJ581 TaxID=3342118 RepID=UPI0035A86757